MAFTTSTVLAIASVAATAAATGISYYSSNQQADNARRIAAYNARVQQNNAVMQYAAAQQANAAQQEILNAQVAARNAEAKVIEQQIKPVKQSAAEDIRRTREEKMRFMASQRAAYAGAGVVMEGTPLAVLAETAGIFESEATDKLWQSEMDIHELNYRADMIRHGGAMEGYQGNLLKIDAASNRNALAAARRGADMTRMEGNIAARGLRTQGYATLLSGASSMAGSYYGGRQSGAL